MYDELVNTLFYDAGWLEQGITQTERDIAEHLRKAAVAIEELSMKLHGDEAAIAGMKREIERMVVAGKPHWIPVAEPPKEERMNEARINLNEVIKVKLTDLGKDIYYHQFDELNRRRGRIVCEPSFPKEDAEGYTKFQLWNFMEIYGEHIGLAQPNVIEPLEIVYELPKEEKK